jgi:protein SCO1/2
MQAAAPTTPPQCARPPDGHKDESQHELYERGRTFRRRVTIGGLCVAAALALAARSMRPRPALAVFGHVPSFHLVNERGAPFDATSMLGHVSVVDFIFTHCTSSCPRLTATMADLQGRLARGESSAKLISFSVDPDDDTPSVLAGYAARVHADLDRWSFVTGSPEDVTRAVVSGFKISAAKIARGAGDYEVTHGDWFVLVDGRQQIRGYYSVDEPGALDTLMESVHRLEKEP